MWRTKRLAFRSCSLAELCNSESALKRQWEPALAAAIAGRLYLLYDLPDLSFVRACPGVLDEPFCPNGDGSFFINVRQRCRIVARARQVPIPRKADGQVACEKIEELLILEVNGYGG